MGTVNIIPPSFFHPGNDSRIEGSILTVCDITSFWSEGGSGITTYLKEKAKSFQGRNEFRHILIVPGDHDSVEDRGNTRIYCLWGPRVLFNSDYRIPFRPFAVRRIFRKEQPDIIEVGSPFILPWLCVWAARHLSARLVSYFHTNFVEAYIAPGAEKFGTTLRNWLCGAGWKYARLLYSQFSLLFVASQPLREKLEGHGILNTQVVPLGVDTKLFHPSKRNQECRSTLTGGEDCGPLALYAGRLHPEKRIDWLLDCSKEMHRQYGVRLVVCGGGHLRRTVERAARDRKDLLYLGPIAGKEWLAQIFASCDFFIVPGVGDTFCLSAVEAMASGLPLLVPDRSVTSQFVEDGCGIMYRSGDPESFMEGVKNVLGDRPAMGKRARDKALSRYSWDLTFERLRNFYAAQ